MTEAFAPSAPELRKMALAAPEVTPLPSPGQGLAVTDAGAVPPAPGTAGTQPFLFTQIAVQNAITFTANTAYLFPLHVATFITPASVRARVTTQSGNMDVGLFTLDPQGVYRRVWSRGSFATPAAGSVTVNITAGQPTGLSLAGGTVYVAVAFDNATAALAGTATSLLPDGFVLTKAASFPLPASISAPANTGGPIPVLAVFP